MKLLLFIFGLFIYGTASAQDSVRVFQRVEKVNGRIALAGAFLTCWNPDGDKAVRYDSVFVLKNCRCMPERKTFRITYSNGAAEIDMKKDNYIFTSEKERKEMEKSLVN